MPMLPTLGGHQVVHIFCQLGWEVSRRRGIHIILTKTGNMASLSVPDHKEVATGTLQSLIRSAGLTVEEFLSEYSKL